MPSAEEPLTPWGPIPIDAEQPGSEMAERIVEAAHACFVEQGVKATTMSQLAAEVGISRMWLYRHFPNRDAVAGAVFGREARRFIQGLINFNDPEAEPLGLAVEGFVYAVRFLRNHELLQSLLDTEAEAITPFLTSRAEPIFRLATETVALFITSRFVVSSAQAHQSAEAMVRLVVSITLTGRGSFDFDDAQQLRAFATAIVPRLLPPIER